MEFKSESKIKATLSIGDVVYKIKAPSLGKSTQLFEDLEANKSDIKKVSEMMVSFISDLGEIPKEKIMELDNEMFNELFSYVVGSKKN